MSEIETLTKTLVQVIGSLQNIITKKGGIQEAQKQEAPIKKAPEMTYNQFLKEVLQNRQPVPVKSQYVSYTLQEDIQLLYELSKYQQLSIKTFEKISKSKNINRSTQSLRSRYHNYLYLIDQKQMKKIVNWIEREGLCGYLIVNNDDVHIQHNDPKQEKKRSRPHQSEIKKLEKTPKKIKAKPFTPSNTQQLTQMLKLYSKMVNIPVRTLTDRLDQLSGDLSELNKYVETKDARMLWTPEQDQILRKGGPELQIIKRYRGINNVSTRNKYLGLQ